jgi:hypothetical protein
MGSGSRASRFAPMRREFRERDAARRQRCATKQP